MTVCIALGLLAAGCALQNIAYPEVVMLGEKPVVTVPSRADLRVCVRSEHGWYCGVLSNYFEKWNFCSGESIDFEAWDTAALRRGLALAPNVPVHHISLMYRARESDLALLDQAKAPRSLYLSNADAISPDVISGLCALRGLQCIGMDGPNALGVAARSGRFTSLVMRAADAVSLADALAGFPALQTLTLFDLADRSAAAIAVLPRLLGLMSVRLEAGLYDFSLKQEHLDALARCAELNSVSFKAGDRTEMSLAFRIPHLVELEYFDPLGRRMPPIAREIQHAQNLRLLRLANLSESEAADPLPVFKALSELPRLEVLEVHIGNPQYLKPLAAAPKLAALTISDNREWTESLVSRLHWFKHLRFIDLSDTQIYDERLTEMGFAAPMRVRCLKPNFRPHVESALAPSR